ncbi:MAG: hypothetical protein KY412_08100 [Actinobacteria bacterium]|nr:hypothetical protein [Actinomycetota bacterium]MBW3645229.1 hypothetical protein [Actinomycetota bacterium]
MATISERVEDAAYVTVGFAVLAFQQAQVRRRELERQLAELGDIVDEHGDDLEGRLPEAIGTLLAAARAVLSGDPAP